MCKCSLFFKMAAKSKTHNKTLNIISFIDNQCLVFVSGYQDSNLGPPAPKAGALTGLRYTPFFLQPLYFRLRCKGTYLFLTTKYFIVFFICVHSQQNRR